MAVMRSRSSDSVNGCHAEQVAEQYVRTSPSVSLGSCMDTRSNEFGETRPAIPDENAEDGGRGIAYNFFEEAMHDAIAAAQTACNAAMRHPDNDLVSDRLDRLNEALIDVMGMAYKNVDRTD
ncbi:hypothetical protein V502_03791 [Pseudogymnoascus sp. VKM F-4520 (FW-2644)]|nr:hypothetical protein V502_03791 [Pseudogymnoascus sp. VKM F-4520 (FW-2644)]